MKNIKENCDAIQEHIRKADKYLTRFMYINSTMEYVIMLPIIHLHKKHFKEVANNIDNIKNMQS